MRTSKKLSGLLFVVLWSFGACQKEIESSPTERTHGHTALPMVTNPEVIPVRNPAVQDLGDIRVPTQNTLKGKEEEDESLPNNKSKDGQKRIQNPTNIRAPQDSNVFINTSDDLALNSLGPNETDVVLSKNISKESSPDQLEVEYEVQDVLLSQEAAVVVAILRPVSVHGPFYINLTGIRSFTGRERVIVDGCLDLSSLQLSGDEVKEVIRRMSSYEFYSVDLSNNSIRELDAGTFSSVEFMVQELRLDGNPLAGGSEGSLGRGALFNLPVLRELNLSNCGIGDLDMWTPWKSVFLEMIDLSYNQLQEVPANLQYFRKLQRLYLVNNPITEIRESPFILLWNLQVLDFTSCLVASISGNPFKFMDSLEELSLMDNKLKRFSEVQLPLTFWDLRVYLSGNPWHCDCDAISYIQVYIAFIPDIHYVRCGSPWCLQGLHAEYLTKKLISLNCESNDVIHSTGRFQHVYIPSTIDLFEFLSLITIVLTITVLVLYRICDKYRYKKKKHLIQEDFARLIIDTKPLCK